MEVSFGVMLLYLTPQPDDDGDYDANAVDDALDDGGDDIGDVDDDNCYGFISLAVSSLFQYTCKAMRC